MMENLSVLGWDVNGKDYEGRTALAVAASQGNLESVMYLVEKGGDITISDMHGYDALKSA